MFPTRLGEVTHYNLNRLNRLPCILGYANIIYVYQVKLD